jgi:antagonist of KipI
MGYRLKGNKLEVVDTGELISTAGTKGTIQLTNEGNLIVLMADSQTIGGYPRIGQVVSVDLPLLAQRRPGEIIQFEFVSYDTACSLLWERERELNKLETAIKLQLKYANR